MVGILFHITLAVFMGTRRVFVAPTAGIAAPAAGAPVKYGFRWSESDFTPTVSIAAKLHSDGRNAASPYPCYVT